MKKHKTKEEFIQEAKEIHGDRYDYSKTDYQGAHKKILIRCKKHNHEFWMRADLHTNQKQKCPKCGIEERKSPHRLTNEICVKRFKEKWGEKYDYSITEYKNQLTKIKYICKNHGIIEQIPKNHLKVGCPLCRNRKKTKEEFIQEAKEIHGDRYDYSKTDYQGAHKKILIRCKKHNHEFWMIASAHIGQKQKCPKCGIEERKSPHRLTNEICVKRFKEKWGEKYDYSITEYKSKNDKIKYICKKHGVVEQFPVLHLRSGCPYCAGRGIGKHTLETFKEKANIRHNYKYDYSNVNFNGIHDKIKIICKKHGEFVQTAYVHFCCGCPKCDIEKTSSQKEIDLRQIISSHYKGNIIGPDRTILDGKEIDIYLSDIKTGFEFHGMYWHIESRYGIRKHFDKANIAKEKGIKLIQIYETEWMEKREIVQSRILGMLGLHGKIHARKTFVKNLSFNEEKLFLNKTHIQGHRNSEIALGLFHNDEIVACMTFCRSRFNKKIDWELLRFSSELNTRVVGGASKLLSHFFSTNSGSLISYSDRRWSNGDMYKQLGFKYDGTSGPGYKYYNLSDKTLHSRIKFQKHKLKMLPIFDKTMTEYENMKMNGFDRIWDAGVDRWIIQ